MIKSIISISLFASVTSYHTVSEQNRIMTINRLLPRLKSISHLQIQGERRRVVCPLWSTLENQPPTVDQPPEKSQMPGFDSSKRGRLVRKVKNQIEIFRAWLVSLMSGAKTKNSLFGRLSGRDLNVARKIRVMLLAFAAVLSMAYGIFGTASRQKAKPLVEIGMSDFYAISAQEGRVKEVRITSSGKLLYQMKMHTAEGVEKEVNCVTVPVLASPQTHAHLEQHKIQYAAAKESRNSASRVLLQMLPLLWVTALMLFQLRTMTGSKGVGRRADKDLTIDRSLTFEDVQGIDDAKMEIQEMVNILKNPYPYIKAGVRLPSGVMLVGPPGTGKTLLARVMAAVAGVPFFYCSGSDFVEMFVGRGAARVRSLFSRAQKSAPCIIFFDEIDALGRQRSGLSPIGGNNEAEQTLNQLLACMDGLDTNNNGVVVIGATNRYEVLDEALTRPGRFDRVVRVNLPDKVGRQSILKVHSRRLKLDDDVDLARIAELTPGLNGAELAAICNEAGIRAVRRNSVEATASDFSKSINDYFKSRGLSQTVQRFFSEGLKMN